MSGSASERFRSALCSADAAAPPATYSLPRGTVRCVGVGLALWWILDGFPGPALASSDPVCLAATATLTAELQIPFSDPNDPGLHERRGRLRNLFEMLTPSCAAELRDTLGDVPTGDSLSELFHHELATPTRNELLDILEVRMAESEPQPEPDPALVFNDHHPLPPDALGNYREALDTLLGAIKVATPLPSNVERTREACWLDKLKTANVDDRIIEWETICPRISMASSPFVTTCDIQFRNVDEQDLHAHIERIEDVEPANEKLFFITHIRPAIVIGGDLTSPIQVQRFRQLIFQSIKAVATLDKMANAMGLGGASAMPRYYRAIAGWIGERQSDPRSVFSCR